jgi:nucleotide-binding universal stress UspA family protein
MSTPERPADWDQPVTIPEVDTAFATVLVPFDGSRGAERALAYAARLAEVTGAEIVIVVAYDPPITVRRRGAITLDQIQSEMEEEATSLAVEAVEELEARGNEARGVVVRGEIVDAIIETAEGEGADIIILGRRGLSHDLRSQGGMRELGHGSVADRVARHADVPVLVVS